MTKAVLLHEEEGRIDEIELDIDPRKNEVFTLLSGRATFIGQWPEIDVVIMRGTTGGRPLNNNRLPPPFHGEEVHGKILLVRMDEESEPRDFTLAEFKALERTPSP